MNDKEKLFLSQIKEIARFYKENSSKLTTEYKDLQEGGVLASSFITRIMAAITRITGMNSEYYKQANSILSNTDIHLSAEKLLRLIGVLTGLSQDLKQGYLRTFSELLHADIFSDYIEMAEYLLDEGYKDPAAVITGSTLEEHLRKLCQKNGIDIKETKGGKTRPKKADTLNSELAKQNVYSKLEQKNVTAWLDLRNKAAHGHYDEYDNNQVNQMIMGVRDFITRNPA